MADAPTLTALELFTQTCVALTEGQHLDMHFETRPQVSVDEYLRMIQGKTAALTGASVAIGALIGGATDAQWDSLHQFGESLGLAFQIQDDILDATSSAEILGKTPGKDEAQDKPNAVAILGLKEAQCLRDQLVENAKKAFETSACKSDNFHILFDLRKTGNFRVDGNNLWIHFHFLLHS